MPSQLTNNLGSNERAWSLYNITMMNERMATLLSHMPYFITKALRSFFDSHYPGFKTRPVELLWPWSLVTFLVWKPEIIPSKDSDVNKFNNFTSWSDCAYGNEIIQQQTRSWWLTEPATCMCLVNQLHFHFSKMQVWIKQIRSTENAKGSVTLSTDTV